MKSSLLALLGLGLVIQSVSAQDKPNLTDPKQRLNYIIGTDIGENLKDLKDQGVELDIKALSAGIADSLADKIALTQDQIKETMTQFQKDMQNKAKVAAEKNLKDGETFLAANKSKTGVKTLASGLQYKVIKSGTGKIPKSTDTVKVHYTGTLIDGTVFDSSVERKEPLIIPVRGVIPGWTEALQLMKVGDKWQLFIPSKLAYGEQAPPKIGPNSVLVFEVELLSIEA